MSRYNSTLKYKTTIPGQQDPVTGFFVEGFVSDWIDAGDCHIEKHTPPKEVKGVDGSTILYVYEIFMPQSDLNLSIGDPIALFDEDGVLLAETLVNGFDRTGRKNISIWA